MNSLLLFRRGGTHQDDPCCQRPGRSPRSPPGRLCMMYRISWARGCMSMLRWLRRSRGINRGKSGVRCQWLSYVN